MTYREFRMWAASEMCSAGIENATAESEFLLEYACQTNLGFYLLHQNEMMPENEFARCRDMVKKRCMRIPLQHLTGSQEFMGLPFNVNEHVLIPRQDTETLVEEALKILDGRYLKTDVFRNAASDGIGLISDDGIGRTPGQIDNIGGCRISEKKTVCRVLDLCTGSGCIAVSLKTFFPDIFVCGTDISSEALEVARNNAALNHAEAEFLESDLFAAVTGQFFMIVSNPPYIPSGEIPLLMPEVRDHEPVLALDGASDGLSFYRRIIRESTDYLLPGGWLLFEIGCEQGNDVSGMMRENGFSQVEVIPDLAGLDRVVRGRRKGNV